VLVDQDPPPMFANFQRSSFPFDETAHGTSRRIDAWPKFNLGKIPAWPLSFFLTPHRWAAIATLWLAQMWSRRSRWKRSSGHGTVSLGQPTCVFARRPAHATTGVCSSTQGSHGGDETLSATVYQMDEHNGGSVLLALRIIPRPFKANADEKVACSNLQSWLEKWTQSAIESAKRVPQ
jgi:hypothetical protein